MTDRRPDGWTSYAPLGVAPDACAFCGQPNRHDGTLMANGDGSVAICKECVSKFAEVFARRSSSQ